ncbi:MAG: MFS transporter, partial [Alicyclobacillus sp.]|nr:MFS transporter [Alicyclobacillus sp.]
MDTLTNQPVVIRNKQDIFDLINRYPVKSKKVNFLILTAMASFFVEGYDIAGFGVAVPSIMKTFSLNGLETGLLNASVSVAAFLAAVVGGYFVDRLGRLKLFFIDMICFVIAGFIGALAPNVATLIVVRFLMGIGIGLDIPAAMTFIAEYTNQQRKRGELNNYMVWNYYSLVTVYLLGWVLFKVGTGPDLWRWMLGLSSIPALMVVIMRYIYIEETPFWLA